MHHPRTWIKQRANYLRGKQPCQHLARPHKQPARICHFLFTQQSDSRNKLPLSRPRSSSPPASCSRLGSHSERTARAHRQREGKNNQQHETQIEAIRWQSHMEASRHSLETVLRRQKWDYFTWPKNDHRAALRMFSALLVQTSGSL